MNTAASATRETGLRDRVREDVFGGVADDEEDVSLFVLLPEHESESFVVSEDDESSPSSSSDFFDELEQLSLLELSSEELVSDDPQPSPEFDASLSSSVVW